MVVALELPAPQIGHRAPSYLMTVQTWGYLKDLIDLVNVGWLRETRATKI